MSFYVVAKEVANIAAYAGAGATLGPNFALQRLCLPKIAEATYMLGGAALGAYTALCERAIKGLIPEGHVLADRAFTAWQTTEKALYLTTISSSLLTHASVPSAVAKAALMIQNIALQALATQSLITCSAVTLFSLGALLCIGIPLLLKASQAAIRALYPPIAPAWPHRNFCRHEPSPETLTVAVGAPATLDHFLRIHGHQIREDLFVTSTRGWTLLNTKFLRSRIAQEVGIYPPLVEPPYDHVTVREDEIAKAKDFIKQSYVLKLLQELHQDLQRADTPSSRLPIYRPPVFKLRDNPHHPHQGTRVAHKIFDEMLQKNLLPDLFQNACEAALTRFQQEIATENGRNVWLERFLFNRQALESLTLENLLDPHHAYQELYKKALLYPILQRLTTQEHLLHYLTQRGLFQPVID